MVEDIGRADAVVPVSLAWSQNQINKALTLAHAHTILYTPVEAEIGPPLSQVEPTCLPACISTCPHACLPA